MKSLRASLALVLVAQGGGALGGILRVPQTFGTILAAIAAATDGDTVLVADGTYIGPGNRDIPFFGKRLIVRSENGPANCTIDCFQEAEAYRAFIIQHGEPVGTAIIGFTIESGSAQSGGALYCVDSSLELAEC